jgi:hypothetical protein
MSKRRRILLGFAIAVPLAIGGLWIAVHRVPWVGPMLADSLRAVIGAKAVEKLERFAYGVEDRANRTLRAGEAPTTRWAVPSASAPVVDAGSVPVFRLDSVAPMHKKVSTEADGVWVPVAAAPSLLQKTLLHPDASRSWAELFVVAMPVERVRLHLVPGTREPRPNAPGAKNVARPGLIPKSAHAELLAAFNGGFKTVHGAYGMGVKGQTVVLPRPLSCTVFAKENGEIGIDTWKKVADQEASFVWWRQTPPCVYEDGRMHGSLWDPDTAGWGAAMGGETVIRRSAIALNEKRDVLYFGVSNHTTARVMADGMHHVGGYDVAQLDVNWSFPKIVTFEKVEGELAAKSVFEGFKIEEGEFLKEPSVRDFFYVTRAE